MLKAGIIGLGVGEQHIDGYQRDGLCQVVALCDFDPEKQEMARQRYPEMTLYASADELLDDPRLDMVSIASYDDCHATQIHHAVRNGLHIFVEKPLCLFTDEARAIAAALDSRPELKISSNLILRCSPRFRDLKQRIAAGELGQLFHLEGDYNYGRLHKITDGWRGERNYYSVIHGGAVHIVDLLLWLVDSPVVEVAAFGNRIASAGSRFRFNDMAVGILKFANGVTGKVSSNYGCVYPHSHRLSVYGTDGTFENGLQHALLYRSRDPQQPPTVLDTAYPGVHKGDLLNDFVRSVASGQPPLLGRREIFASMSVCLALEKSLQSGKTVLVDDMLTGD